MVNVSTEIVINLLIEERSNKQLISTTVKKRHKWASKKNQDCSLFSAAFVKALGSTVFAP